MDRELLTSTNFQKSTYCTFVHRKIWVSNAVSNGSYCSSSLCTSCSSSHTHTHTHARARTHTHTHMDTHTHSHTHTHTQFPESTHCQFVCAWIRDLLGVRRSRAPQVYLCTGTSEKTTPGISVLCVCVCVCASVCVCACASVCVCVY